MTDITPQDTGTDDPAPAPDPTQDQIDAATEILERCQDALENFEAIAGAPKYMTVSVDDWTALETAGLAGWLDLRDTGRVRLAETA